jgi:hypothetical protein
MQDSYDITLMKLFRERDNKDQDQARIGKIISVEPIKVALFNGAAIFIENDLNTPLYVTDTLKNKELNANDNVLCIPLSNGQAYAAIDKI